MGTPTGLAASAGDAQVALTWNATAGATSYVVLRGGVQVGTPTTTSFTDTGLTNGTAYTYTIKAVIGSVSSAASTAVSSTPIATAPAAPTGLTATAAKASGKVA